MDSRVATAIKVLTDNPRAHPSEIASLVHLSPSRLRHLFIKEGRMSMGNFSRWQILLRAAYLLARTHVTVKEVRIGSGFDDASSFCRAFKKQYCQSPREYRRQHQTVDITMPGGGAAARTVCDVGKAAFDGDTAR